MKFQLCSFIKSNKDGKSPEGDWKFGIAKMNYGFDYNDVDWIVDLDNGKRIERIWDYKLSSHPMSFIDTDYIYIDTDYI